MAVASIGIPSATLHLAVRYPRHYHWRLRLAIITIKLASLIAPKQVQIEVETTITAD